MQGIIHTQSSRPNALPHLQEQSLSPTSPTVPIQYLLVHLICAITEEGAPSSVMAHPMGVLHLLGKELARTDPSMPNNFRPIALTLCLGKLCTSVLKWCWMQFMISHGYLNTNVRRLLWTESLAALSTMSSCCPSLRKLAGGTNLWPSASWTSQTS